MIQLGLLLALACALGTNIAFLCKHRGAVAAPEVRMRHPLRSAAALFRSPWWTIGFSIAVVAWGLHVAALALAPLSVVQVVIAGGLVLLAYPAERWFGLRLGRRQWAGLTLAAAGLALLAVTGGASGEHGRFSVPAMIAFESALVLVGIVLLIPVSARGPRAHSGLTLGIAGGLLVGVSDVAVKGLAHTVPSDLLALLSPWTVVALLASILAFFAVARGLQVGEAISVIALSSVAANCAAILGGILVFGDPVGSDTIEIVARSLAFVAVLVAIALVPAPLRAARASQRA